MGWTEERVEQLKRLWAEGLSASQIAGRLGGVTRNAVIGKVHRLGLSGRATTSRMKTHRAASRRHASAQSEILRSGRSINRMRTAIFRQPRSSLFRPRSVRRCKCSRNRAAAGLLVIHSPQTSISAIAIRCPVCPIARSMRVVLSNRRRRAAAIGRLASRLFRRYQLNRSRTRSTLEQAARLQTGIVGERSSYLIELLLFTGGTIR